MTIVELVVWMGTTVAAAVGFLIVASVCIGGVLGPMALTDPVGGRACRPEIPEAGHRPEDPNVLTAMDLAVIAKKGQEVRESVRKRHVGYGVATAGKQDGRAGVVVVDVEA